jgi:antitoxin HicB
VKKEDSHIGSSLDDFLKAEGIFEEIRAAALKEVLEWQLQKSIKKAVPE